MPITPDLFAQSTLEVARRLVGMELVSGVDGEVVSGRIVEAEAYLGPDDPASHAAGGPTARSAIMFGPPGVAYVYLIYGMHHCLNVVTRPAGSPGAVLIRALEPKTGLETMARRRLGARPRQERSLFRRDLCNGPGKLCQALGVDLTWNRLPFGSGTGKGKWLQLEQVDNPVRLVTTPRIGISKAAGRPYRFVDAGSGCLSVPWSG
jgi:DNA-3-methyladenine glycosylase